MQKLISALLVLSFCFVSPAYAKLSTGTGNKKGTQYYEGTINGLSDYMDDLKARDEKLYDKLSSDFQKLKDKDKLSSTISLVTVATGLALVVGSFTFLNPKPTNPYDTQPMFATGPMFGGVILVGLAPLARAIIGPTHKDYMNFINKHNRLDPDSPLELSGAIGVTPKNQLVAGLTLAF